MCDREKWRGRKWRGGLSNYQWTGREKKGGIMERTNWGKLANSVCVCALHSFFQDEEKEEKEEKRLRLKWSSCFSPPSETLFFLSISPFYLLLLKISYRCVQEKERKRVREEEEEEEAVEAQKKNPHHKKMQCHNETGPFLSFLSLGRRCGEN